jgi:hypothetical protein
MIWLAVGLAVVVAAGGVAAAVFSKPKASPWPSAVAANFRAHMYATAQTKSMYEFHLSGHDEYNCPNASRQFDPLDCPRYRQCQTEELQAQFPWKGSDRPTLSEYERWLYGNKRTIELNLRIALIVGINKKCAKNVEAQLRGFSG